MSGDFGPRETVPSVLAYARRNPDINLLVVGQAKAIESVNPRLFSEPNISLVERSSVVSCDDRPSSVLRRGMDTSLYGAVSLVADGRADACVSAGNTGALMAVGRYLLHTHPGIERPAIASAIPTATGNCFMLDLGANVDCSAEHLFQFAIMGSVLAYAVGGMESPRVALLNIGSEEVKGNEQVKLASRLIQENSRLNYIGYIEGDDICRGRADVVVCDGFVGNVALKSSEGLARLLGGALKEGFNRSLYRRMLGFLARPVLAELQQVMDPSRRNGASLLGLRGIVVKSHGAANSDCFGHAIEQARLEVMQKVPFRINEHLCGLL